MFNHKKSGHFNFAKSGHFNFAFTNPTAASMRPSRPVDDPKAKKPAQILSGLFLITSLTITYFHTGCSTIIGAKSFHGPVRDGKGWDRLAMVIRHDLYESQLVSYGSESGRSSWVACCITAL